MTCIISRFVSRSVCDLAAISQAVSLFLSMKFHVILWLRVSCQLSVLFCLHVVLCVVCSCESDSLT